MLTTVLCTDCAAVRAEWPFHLQRVGHCKSWLADCMGRPLHQTLRLFLCCSSVFNAADRLCDGLQAQDGMTPFFSDCWSCFEMRLPWVALRIDLTLVHASKYGVIYGSSMIHRAASAFRNGDSQCAGVLRLACEATRVSRVENSGGMQPYNYRVGPLEYQTLPPRVQVFASKHWYSTP
jgi:hypothetical protein